MYVELSPCPYCISQSFSSRRADLGERARSDLSRVLLCLPACLPACLWWGKPARPATPHQAHLAVSISHAFTPALITTSPAHPANNRQNVPSSLHCTALHAGSSSFMSRIRYSNLPGDKTHFGPEHTNIPMPSPGHAISLCLYMLRLP